MTRFEQNFVGRVSEQVIECTAKNNEKIWRLWVNLEAGHNQNTWESI